MKKLTIILFIFFLGPVFLISCSSGGVIAASGVTAINSLGSLQTGGTTVKIKGAVKTGLEIGTDYHKEFCSDPFYLEDDSGYVQIWFVSDTEGTKADSSALTSYLGSTVEVTGVYMVPICQALCICDPFVAIDEIVTTE